MTEMHVLSKQHRPTPQNLSWLNTELQAILKWPANLYTASSLWLPFTGPQYLNTPACMYLRTSAPATHLDCSPWIMCLASQLVSPGCHGKTPQPGRLRQNCMASQFLGLKVPAQSAGWLVLRESSGLQSPTSLLCPFLCVFQGCSGGRQHSTSGQD